MTATVDINVLLDVFQNRQPHFTASAQVVGLVVAGELTGVCPVHGLTTLYYLVRKHAAKQQAEAAMDQILDHFQLGQMNAAAMREARQMPMDDFEDAVVAVVARATASRFIITRNVEDFAASPVPAISPEDFLSQWKVLF